MNPPWVGSNDRNSDVLASYDALTDARGRCAAEIFLLIFYRGRTGGANEAARIDTGLLRKFSIIQPIHRRTFKWVNAEHVTWQRRNLSYTKGAIKSTQFEIIRFEFRALIKIQYS